MNNENQGMNQWMIQWMKELVSESLVIDFESSFSFEQGNYGIIELGLCILTKNC